jgi:tRNA G18 (ribose-2'-O)-methylase SpoU
VTDEVQADDQYGGAQYADGRYDDTQYGDMGQRPSTDVGVGPWAGDWPTGDSYDADLLASGDTRNVADRYRYWRHDAIVTDLDSHRHSFHVAIENWQHDLNIGSVVRTANAFLAAEVHVVGRRRWNRRGAMVTDRYQHLRHHESVETFREWAVGADLQLLGVDNLPGAVPLETARLPLACVLVFGQEGPGLSDAMRTACQVTLSIAQFGSTRSINAGAAAAIAMHAWVRQHAVLDFTTHKADRPRQGAPPASV